MTMEIKDRGTETLYDVDDVMKAVQDIPEDLCYHAQAMKVGAPISSACVYAHITDKGTEPVCMVGYILWKLNPKLLDKIIDRVENKQGLDETFLHEEFTHPAFRLLQEWQAVQDRNQEEPWAKIVHDFPLEALV